MLSVPDGPGHGFFLYIVPLCCLGLSAVGSVPSKGRFCLSYGHCRQTARCTSSEFGEERRNPDQDSETETRGGVAQSDDVSVWRTNQFICTVVIGGLPSAPGAKTAT